jgi:hypothetical protein
LLQHTGPLSTNAPKITIMIASVMDDSGDEDDTPVAPGSRPLLLDFRQRHGVNVEGDLASGNLLEQAVIRAAHVQR